MRKYISFFIFIFSIITFIACSMGGYETGDGPNSYLQSSFGQMHTDSEALVSGCSLDDGSELTLSEKKSINGAKADTIYRGLIYYSTTDRQTSLVGFAPALVCLLADKSKVKDFIQDPIDIESAWISENGSYFNLSLLTKIGAISDGGKLALGIALDHVDKMADGNRHYFLSLYHDQSTVPEYYTDKTYLSLPLASELSALSINKGDSLTIDYINTKLQVITCKLQVK